MLKTVFYLLLLQVMSIQIQAQVIQTTEDIADNCYASECPFWEFQCTGSGGCVNMAKFCDGRIDCEDGSDEVYIEDTNNSTYLPYIACNNLENLPDLTCLLPEKYHCDAIAHCHNNADESEAVCKENRRNRYIKRCYAHEWCMNNKVLDKCQGCEERTGDCDGRYCSYSGDDLTHDCASYIFRCDDGKCLRAEQFCDGVVDCEDGSDERTEVTSPEEFLCKNKWSYFDQKCILPKRYVCDGINHCENRTDECVRGCEYSFICNNNKCITSGLGKSAPVLIGNGRDDCGDSSDEINEFGNTVSSRNYVFKCNENSNISIVAEKFCDGKVDCPNGEDEMYLSNVTGRIGCKNKLVALELTCVVPDHHICDDATLCANFEDELGCGNDYDYYTCPDGKTIRNSASVVCNFHVDCCDDSDECEPERNCSSTFTCLSDGKCLAFQRFCDGVVDCADGSDEYFGSIPIGGINVNSTSFDGVLCDNLYNKHDLKCWLPRTYQCDGIDHCRVRTDECLLGCEKSFICESSKECVEREKFCDGEIDCVDGSDEKTTGMGFKCTVRHEVQKSLKTCILPQDMIMDSVKDCEDMMDRCDVPGSCFRCASRDLNVSTNQVCDGVFDCPDLSDECLCEGSRMSNETSKICQNFYFDRDVSASEENCDFGQISCDFGGKCIDISQVCNDVADCEDGSDEKACSKPVDSKKSNKSEFKCSLENFENVNAVKCDGIPQCSDFSDECSTKKSLSRNNTDEVGNRTDGGDTFECGSRTLKICSELVKDRFQLYHCPKNQMPVFPSEICNGIEDCFENFLPENEHGMKMKGRQWSQFSVDEKFCKNRFLCSQSYPVDSNLVSIPQSQMCDGNINCYYGEDENEKLCKNVTKRFYCEYHQTNTDQDQIHSIKNPLFVSIHQMFDGKEDCLDGSDECPSNRFDESPFSSRYRMIKDSFLSGFVWMMAFAALNGNFFVIWHNLRRLGTNQRLSPMMKTNCVLILNLAAADFIMGIYLMALAIQNVRTEGEYCKYDKEWRTGLPCKFLGTLAMISSQCSVLVLIILTTYRVMTVLKPFSANMIQGKYTGIFLTGAWTLATTVAIIPHLVALEDYFVSSAWLSSSVNLFDTNTPDKNSLQRFVQRLEALQQLSMTNDSRNLSSLTGDPQWTDIRQSLSRYYPDTWPSLTVIGYFGFYGSNSVCLPQMFVTTDTKSWVYSIAVIVFDLCSCFYIAFSYIVVYYDAKRVVTSSQKDEENKTMQTRITRLVLTDFACWVPICVIAILSLTGVSFSPSVYAVAAIVLLPINSALNPILYSNTFSLMYTFCIKPGSSFLRKRASKRRESFNQSRNRSNNSRTSVVVSSTFNDFPQSAESIPMVPINSESSQNGLTQSSKFSLT